MPFKNLLVPVDTDDSASLHAIRHAVSLSRRFGAKVVLTHVIDFSRFPMYAVPISGMTMDELQEAAVERSNEALEDLARSSPLRTVPVAVDVRVGKGVARTVLEFAEELEADLILMGIRPSTMFGRHMMGAVAGKVMWATRRPVLFVPGGDGKPSSTIPEYRAVLFATDLSEASERVAAKAGEFARGCSSRVDLLHVTDPETFESDAERRNLEDRLRQLGARHFDALAYDVHILAGRPSYRIDLFARKNRSNVLFLGTHGRHGLSDYLVGSTATRVVRTLPCSVMLDPVDTGR
jgi:nucleotide-binding universal stress UspA family protein